MGVDLEAQMGIAGTGVPHIKVAWMITMSQITPKPQHDAFEMVLVRPGGRMRTTVTIMDILHALKKGLGFNRHNS